MATTQNFLPREAIEKLSLEDLTLVSTEEAIQSNLQFAGIDIVTIQYDTHIQKTDHYLLRDDPYTVVQGKCNSASLKQQKPEHVTHYTLGPKHHDEYVRGEGKRYGHFVDYIPIVFFRQK